VQNVWLTTDDGTGHNIWIDPGDDHRLEIAIRPANAPGFRVTIVKASAAEPADYIRRNCEGMSVRKLDLEGTDQVGESPQMPRSNRALSAAKPGGAGQGVWVAVRRQSANGLPAQAAPSFP
jgi:hypothetical protein